MLLLTPALLFGLFVMTKKDIIKVWTKFNDRTYIWWEKFKWKCDRYLLCKCKCWKEDWIRLHNLKHNKSNSCKSCATTKQFTKHWFRHTRFYKIYAWIKSRCQTFTATNYKNYWWRWIICERKTFNDFKNDMYNDYINHVKIYWEKNTEIDRINTNWNYCKENCKRSTRKEQCNNMRRNIKYKYWYTIDDLCNKYNLSKNTMYKYLSRHKDKIINYLETRRKIK